MSEKWFEQPTKRVCTTLDTDSTQRLMATCTVLCQFFDQSGKCKYTGEPITKGKNCTEGFLATDVMAH